MLAGELNEPVGFLVSFLYNLNATAKMGKNMAYKLDNETGLFN